MASAAQALHMSVKLVSIDRAVPLTRIRMLAVWANLRGRLWRAVKKMEAVQKNAFVAGGHHQHGGLKWRALKPSTIKRKKKFPFPDKPLVRTGRMGTKGVRIGVTAKASVMSGTFFLSWLFANKERYASYHQKGFFHPGGEWIAPRPPVWITVEDVIEISREIKTALFPYGLSAIINYRIIK